MRKRLEMMAALARRICDEERMKADVRGVLLFGSVAEGNVHSESDLDLVVIKAGQDAPVKRNKHKREGVIVDLWEHSLSCYENLFRKDWKPSAIFFYSLFLNILQACEILHDPDGRFGEYREKARKWSWPHACRTFIERRWERGLNAVRELDDSFEKLASMRRLFLVKACRTLVELGRPVSIRNKDYYLIFSKLSANLSMNDFRRVFGRIPSLRELESLVRGTLSLFAEEVPEREPWTEFEDARKHLSSNELFLVALSLQNAAYYLGCRGLKNRGVRIGEAGYLWPESELGLIEKTRAHWSPFYAMYQAIHNARSWRADEINECFTRIFPEVRMRT